MANNTFVIKLNDHKVPEFKEERSKDWILYGSKGKFRNRYPDYLLDLYNSSAKHHAIINGKTDYIVGNGFVVDTAGIDLGREAAINNFVNKPNANESLNALLAKCVLDFEIYNGFALEIIYNKTNERIAAIHHAEFKQYRKAKEGDFYYYSEDWSKSNPDTEVITAFDFNNPSGKQLLYVKAYHPMAQAYPLPTYLGCIPYIEVDREIANYQLNEIKNNFQSGVLINMNNGQPPIEEQKDIERQWEAKYTGTDNANRLLLSFNDSKEQASDIVSLMGNDFADRYQILEKTTQQNIFTGHRITSGELFGVKEEGIFSSRNQLRDAYELFQNTYVNNRQEQLLAVFNGLAMIQGFVGRLDIQDTEPIGVGFSESTRASVMTEDEIRIELGLPVIVIEDDADAPVDTKTKDAQAALKGSVGGVGGIITLLQNVSTGVVKTESAISILIELYGFTEDVARATVTGDTIPAAVAQEMRDTLEDEGEEFRVTEAFAACGETIDEDSILFKRQVHFTDDNAADISEDNLRRFGFGTEAFNLAVLDLLKEDPSLSWSAIAEQMESTADEVMEAVQSLVALDYLVVGIESVLDTTQKISEVTSKGTSAIESGEPLSVTLKIGYRYVKRVEASGAAEIPTTRDFCKKMLAASVGKYWTNSQIQDIGVSVNRNVWQRMGGFWSNGGRVTPYCRHTWEQIVINPAKDTQATTPGGLT